MTEHSQINNSFSADPLVSVVIPVFNGEAFIGECLESVQRQTYQSVEILMVDDGSSDRSLEIAHEFSKDIKVIQQAHGDVSQARNTGVTHSTGKLIAFLDQDDAWLPRKLEKQVQVFKRDPELDLVFTDIVKVYSSGTMHHAKDKHRIALSLTHENLFASLVQKNVLMPSAVMVKKQSFQEAGCFDPDFKTCGDYEMWMRMAALDMKFHYLPEALTHYRQHGQNTSKRTETMYHDRLKAVRKVFGLNGLSSEKKRLENHGLAAAYILGAHTFFSAKRYDLFLENARLAWRYRKKVFNAKFVTRYLRSLYYTKISRKA